MIRAFRAILPSFILLSSAGPIEDATAALERRDSATALQLLRPLAERGNADAQMKLGFLYVAGGGIPQDYAAAVEGPSINK
jgi:TPR repeat protein